jgi:hypothetical protein
MSMAVRQEGFGENIPTLHFFSAARLVLQGILKKRGQEYFF